MVCACRCLFWICLHSLFASPISAQTAVQPIIARSVETGGCKYQAKKQELNENTVVIVSGQTSGTYLKLAEDLQNVLDRRDTNELCILPVVGTPGPQNILDVRGHVHDRDRQFRLFQGADAALCGDIGSKINYFAKLYNMSSISSPGKI